MLAVRVSGQRWSAEGCPGGMCAISGDVQRQTSFVRGALRAFLPQYLPKCPTKTKYQNRAQAIHWHLKNMRKTSMTRCGRSPNHTEAILKHITNLPKQTHTHTCACLAYSAYIVYIECNIYDTYIVHLRTSFCSPSNSGIERTRRSLDRSTPNYVPRRFRILKSLEMQNN